MDSEQRSQKENGIYNKLIFDVKRVQSDVMIMAVESTIIRIWRFLLHDLHIVSLKQLWKLSFETSLMYILHPIWLKNNSAGRALNWQ